MKRAFVKFAVVCLATMLLLSGCMNKGYVIPINHKDYDPKKADCFQIISDNAAQLDAVLLKLENYDNNIGFWLTDGSVEVNVGGNISESEMERIRSEIKSDKELMNNLLSILDNEYVTAVTRSKGKIQTEYSFAVYFVDIARGYSSFAYYDDSDDAERYGEHIAGEWYYFIGAYE